MIQSKHINNIIRTFISCICLFIVFNNVLFERYDRNQSFIVSIIVLGISIYLVFFYKNNTICLFMYLSIMYFNYSIIVTRYFFDKDKYLFSIIDDQRIYGIGINIILVFMAMILMLAKKNRIKKNSFENLSIIKPEKKNAILCIFFIFINVIIFVLQIAMQGRGITNQLYEYSIIFFLIAYYYSGNNKIIINILNFIMVCFCLRTFISGDRVSVLQLITVYVLIVKINKLNFNRIIMLTTIGIIFMSALGLYGDGKSMSNVISVLKDRLFALDTSVFAYFTSLTFVKVKDITTIIEQLKLFLNFVLSLIFGGGVPNSSLTAYTRMFYLHYNGGLLPAYFYFYLGWIGVILSGMLVSYYTRIIVGINKISSDYKKILSIYIVATVPRWYLYSPVPLIRGVMLLSLVFLVSQMICSITKQKKVTITI